MLSVKNTFCLDAWLTPHDLHMQAAHAIGIEACSSVGGLVETTTLNYIVYLQ
jgi:hypothetical protein